MTEPVMLNFIGTAKPEHPEKLVFPIPFAPVAGDAISFPGVPGAYLVHSREFRVGADGAEGQVILNLVPAKPAN